MRRFYLLPAVYLADQIAGDPEWIPHPVRWMGAAITRGEVILREPGQSPGEEFLRGALLTASLVTSSYLLTRLVIREAYNRSRALGLLTEILLGWTCIAARSLEQEASSVLAALDSNDLELARRQVARIVGRDTAQLDMHEICRAVIETLAENASDGIIAPLFYMFLGGVPLAMAYKAVNTLDSMIGHADIRYFYFGKAAARSDDAANYLPARLTALVTVVASMLLADGNPQAAWSTWLRDGSLHKSLNAGHPESAMAGTLGVRLGGGNIYKGEYVPAPSLGSEFRLPIIKDARKALRIVSVVTLVGLGAGILIAALFRRKG